MRRDDGDFERGIRIALLPSHMHLARITGGTVAHAAATGGDADPLALLLGAAGGAVGPAFPATLQAALAAGDTADEALDVVDVAVSDDDAPGEDGSGTSLEAALAAVLGLGAVVTPQVPGEAKTTDGGELGPQAVDVSASGDAAGVKVVAGAAAAPAVAASAGAAAAGTPAIDPQQVASAAGQRAAAAADVTAVVRPAPTPAENGKSDGKDVRLAPPGELTTVATGGTQAGVVADAAPAVRPVPQAAHADTAPGAHHGVVDADRVAATTAFSSGGSTQHGLDLGTSERQTSTSVAQPATPLATTTAPPVEGEKIHVTTAPSGDGARDATAALPPSSTASAPQEGAAPRTSQAVQHPGGIEARWGERVADALRLSSVRGGGEIRLQLEPEGLGHIDVRLHLQPDGVRAVIIAEHESTRALLTSQQHVLQDAFTRSDLRLSGFSVDVGSGGGAATFGAGAEAGEGGSADSTPAAPAPLVPAADVLESTTVPLASGRVNVRV